MCPDHLDLFNYHVEAAPVVADKHDAVTIGIKVMRSVSSGATRHEEKSMILKVNLVTIGEYTAPIAHAVVLKEASAKDVVR